MSNFTCFYYSTFAGRVPVREFIDSLDIKGQKKFFFVKGLLEEFGPRLPRPHSKYIGDEIYEIIFFSSPLKVRVLYFFDGDRVIFTNGFFKKTQKTPENEKRLAASRRKEFLKK